MDKEQYNQTVKRKNIGVRNLQECKNMDIHIIHMEIDQTK